jgi:hypothetical protein
VQGGTVKPKETHMNDTKVAGLLFKKSKDGSTSLISTVLPEKSSGLDDFSITTVWGTKGPQQNGYTAMAEAIQHTLGVSRADVIKEHFLFAQWEETKKKFYHWYAIELKSDVEIVTPTAKVVLHTWNPPVQLVHTMTQMSGGRRSMFTRALAEACDKGLLDRSDFPFLPARPLEVQLILPMVA